MPSAQPEAKKYLAGQAEGILDNFSRRTVENSAAYLRPSLEPHMHILDIGCGPGSITIDLARHVPQGHVTGIEVSFAVLEKARAQAKAVGITNTTFAPGDGLALPFADNTFDVAHAHQVAQHVGREQVAFLCEMLRVTKPGGFVACRVWDSNTLIVHPPREGVDVMRAMSRRMDERLRKPLDDGRNLHIWARHAGYDPARIKVSTSTWTYRTPEERKYHGTPFQSMCVDSEWASAGLEMGLTTKEELQKMSEGWQQWIEDEDGFSVMLHVEMLYRK